MRIAVFQSSDEILILQVKGTKKDASSIDGFDTYFAPDMGRTLADYTVTISHLGSGEGLSISTKLVADVDGSTLDIGEWFPEPHDEEPGPTIVDAVSPPLIDIEDEALNSSLDQLEKNVIQPMEKLAARGREVAAAARKTLTR